MDALKRTTWNFFPGTQLTFGPNAVTALAGVIDQRQAHRVFLVTDNILQETGAVEQAEKAISQTTAELHVFTDDEVEPSVDAVERTVGAAREFNPDIVIALGGGSNMDLAKACCAVLRNDCPAESLLGFDKVPGPSLPLVCVPTTSGTGSEVSHSAFLNASTAGAKATIVSQHIRPDVAIVDPYMTLSCPAPLTAASGMGAMAHAIEAYLATNFFQVEESVLGNLPHEGNNPLGDMYAEKAMQLVAQHLAKAVEEPENLSARSGLSLAATLAGVTISNCGAGVCRALEHSVTSMGARRSWGTVGGIVLPEVIRFHAQQRPGKVAKIAGQLSPTFAGLPIDEATDAVVEFLSDLRLAVGLPTTLSAIGIAEQQLPELAAATFSQQPLIDVTPSSTTEADVLSMLKG